MQYVLLEWEHDLDDEPYMVYSELDGARREVRKVEFYRNGLCFSYGAERGNEAALSPTPFPADLRTLEQSAEVEEPLTAREIPPALFYEIWNQAQERPDGFMSMLF